MTFVELCNELIERLQPEMPFGLGNGHAMNCFPLLSQFESMRVAELGASKWPGCLVEYDGDFANLNIATSIPLTGEFYSAHVSVYGILPEENEIELKSHLLFVVKAWLRESQRQGSLATQETPVLWGKKELRVFLRNTGSKNFKRDMESAGIKFEPVKNVKKVLVYESTLPRTR